VAAPAQAQNSVGVLGGYNIAHLTFDPPISRVYREAFGFDASSSGVTGLAAGIFLERPLVGGRPRLRMEGLFSQAGTRIEGSASNILFASTATATPFDITSVEYTFQEEIKLSMLEVPVIVVVPLGINDKVRLMGGGFLAFNLTQREIFRETRNGESREINREGDDQAQIKSRHFGVALGAEVRLTPRIGVGGRFNLGLRNLDDEDDFDSLKMRIIRIYVAIKLK
jgi:hypothetical protein